MTIDMLFNYEGVGLFHCRKSGFAKQISRKFQQVPRSNSGQRVPQAYRAKGNLTQGSFETPRRLASVKQAD